MTIRITFCGAARTVTGSRYLVETDSARVLVDAGMFQDREYQGFNWENYRVNPATLDAVVLTHGHMDHCGWLPKLVKDGFAGPVYATPATADLVPIIVRDIANIQMEDARTKAERHAKEGRSGRRPIVPLYDDNDAETAISRLRAVDGLDEPVEVAPGVTASWGENGHILGASWIALEAEGKRIVFSGDVGRWDRPILHDPIPPTHADCLIIESTYGNRTHLPVDTEDELRQVAAKAKNKGGNLLIPSFSVERAQELLYSLSRLAEKRQLPQKAVYLDSPMATRVTELFSRHPEVCDKDMLERMHSGHSPFAFNGLHFIATSEESKQLNNIRSGIVIIAGNGMCTGGRIKHHLVRHLENPNSTLLFAGFQAPGTLGRLLVDGTPEIRLFNRIMPVKIEVAQLNGLSGHADRTELLRWVGGMERPPARCFVTHGESEAAESLAAAFREEKGWNSEVPKMWETAEL